MSQAETVSLGAALASFRQREHLPEDEDVRSSWTCRIGPVLLRLPNFGWRRRAIRAHDLHHVLTEYPCTLSGECRMAAWEFAAGPMPHWGAALFCLPLVSLGLIYSPRQMWRAFLAGSGARTLHNRNVDAVLPLPLAEARAAIFSPVRASLRIYLLFIWLCLQSALLLIAPVVSLFILMMQLF